MGGSKKGRRLSIVTPSFSLLLCTFFSLQFIPHPQTSKRSDGFCPRSFPRKARGDGMSTPLPSPQIEVPGVKENGSLRIRGQRDHRCVPPFAPVSFSPFFFHLFSILAGPPEGTLHFFLF